MASPAGTGNKAHTDLASRSGRGCRRPGWLRAELADFPDEKCGEDPRGKEGGTAIFGRSSACRQGLRAQWGGSTGQPPLRTPTHRPPTGGPISGSSQMCKQAYQRLVVKCTARTSDPRRPRSSRCTVRTRLPPCRPGGVSCVRLYGRTRAACRKEAEDFGCQRENVNKSATSPSPRFITERDRYFETGVWALQLQRAGTARSFCGKESSTSRT